MAQTYLRDRTYTGITVDERLIRDLYSVVSAQARVAPQTSSAPVSPVGGMDHAVIRFDDGGFRVWSVEELFSHYDTADQVERLCFVVESNEAIATQRGRGSYAEVRLDAQEGTSSYVVAASDDLVWVNNTFNAFSVALQRSRNKNRIARWPIVGLVMQLIGLFVGFLVSLWAAGRMAPSLAIENAFIYCFIFAFVLTSILWSAAANWVHYVVKLAFPNVRFVTKKNPGPKWLVQALLGAIAFAVLGLVADSTWRWLAGFASVLIKQGT